MIPDLLVLPRCRGVRVAWGDARVGELGESRQRVNSSIDPGRIVAAVYHIDGRVNPFT